MEQDLRHVAELPTGKVSLNRLRGAACRRIGCMARKLRHTADFLAEMSLDRLCGTGFAPRGRFVATARHTAESATQRMSLDRLNGANRPRKPRPPSSSRHAADLATQKVATNRLCGAAHHSAESATSEVSTNRLCGAKRARNARSPFNAFLPMHVSFRSKAAGKRCVACGSTRKRANRYAMRIDYLRISQKPRCGASL